MKALGKRKGHNLVRLQLVGSEKQKGESCIGEGGSELPLQLSTYYQRVRA
jgi:hypothetical protein